MDVTVGNDEGECGFSEPTPDTPIIEAVIETEAFAKGTTKVVYKVRLLALL